MGALRSISTWAAIPVIVSALGCSDSEIRQPGEILGPVPATTPIGPGDLHADSSTTVDTAYVAPGHVDELVGAVVNDDGSITKGGIDIGNLAAPGPIGPTGTTGVPGTGSGSGGPGSGSGGGAVPDKGAPIFNPAGPQSELWCMVRIVYGLDTGRIYSATILFCWDDGTGGGSGGGGGSPTPNAQEVTFTLSCPPMVTRGDTGKCSVTVEDEDGGLVDTGAFTFSWSSSTGATASGTGMDTWDGTATEDATVTVTVGGKSDSAAISVRARNSYGASSRFHASIAYTTALAISVYGDHRIDPGTPSAGSPIAGDGPWEGRWMSGSAPTVGNRIRIQRNYTTSGPDHPAASSVCSQVAYLASYYDVNSTSCGSWLNALAWRQKVITHERDHENEYNRCLRDSGIFDRMEEVIGSTSGVVSNEVWRVWDGFYQGTLVGKLQGRTYARAISSGTATFWHVRATGWTNQSNNVAQHGVRSSC